MGEIKFRAWDKDDLCMVKRPFVVSCFGQAFDEYHGGGFVKSNYLLMQYTGLRDKNGKEIYEGDVVMIEDYYNDYQDGIAINSIPDNRIEAVEWEQRHGMWTVETDALYEVATECEVIGNVWENPELLKD